MDAGKNAKVFLRLNGVTITCSDDAAIRVNQADKVFLTLAEGTENTVTSGETYSEAALADKTDGAIFAHDDLTINGSGALTVTAAYKHGIAANDSLRITGGKITVTGSLGDVMKESAQLAVTWVRVHAAEYGIDPEKLKKCDLHIHAPEGAVPKDGPSAGVTLTTALVSCLSGIPVRGDVAMTGEITLHGNVLPIGGLREKSMAAYREGMKTVLIPKDNEPDLYEVDDEVKKNLTFLPMQSLTQVLNAALLKPQNAKKAKAPSRTHAKKKAADAAIVPPTAEKPQPGAVC